MRAILLFAFGLIPFLLPAQLPSTEVWLFSYTYSSHQYYFGAGKNISNQTGYDNQPSFSENGTYMLWTSQRDSNETDIMRYDLSTHTTTRITTTAYSEYSPTYMFGNKYISSVVVEKDSVQRLWRYNKLNGEGKPLLPKIYGVGYHCWFDANTVFLFQITNPSTLVIADARSGINHTCVNSVGRCMQIYRSPKRKMLLYTHEADSSKRWIKALDGEGNKVADFSPIPALEGSQDFAVDLNGNILMAQGSKIYSWTIGESTEWKLIVDLASQGITSITRISISPDGSHIAIVDNKP